MSRAGRSELLRGLRHPDCYPHAVKRIRAVDLGSSWVLLTGPYAYKIRKPLVGARPDCSTLPARRFACEEELRLNRRLGSRIYLGIVEIRGTLEQPRLDGPGPVLDYALKLRQFNRDAVASRMVARGTLTADLMEKLGRELAKFHASITPPERTRLGTPGQAYRRAIADFQEIERLSRRANERGILGALRSWTECEFLLKSRHFQRRWESQCIREGHGDLQLRKLVLVDGELVPIDCIAHRLALRCQDVMDEVAMLMADLLERDAQEPAQAFLDAYLQESGDYEGLAVLRFYVVQSLLAHARNHLRQARCAEPGSAREMRRLRGYERCIAIAFEQVQPGSRGMVLMHGVCASARSDSARTVARSLGGIIVSASGVNTHMAEASRAPDCALPHDAPGAPHKLGVYLTLAQRARHVLSADYFVIVDAPFMRRRERDEFARITSERGLACVLLSVPAPEALLHAAHLAEFAPRVSEALGTRLAVLERELSTGEPVLSSEHLTAVEVPRHGGLAPRVLARVRAALDVHGTAASQPPPTGSPTLPQSRDAAEMA
jgi:hypothetical protein